VSQAVASPDTPLISKVYPYPHYDSTGMAVAHVALDEKLLPAQIKTPSAPSPAASNGTPAAAQKPSQPQMAAEDDFKFVDADRSKLGNDIEAGGLCCPGALSCILGTICPCPWCCACTTLDERQEKVLLNWGKYHATIRQPGCYCWNPFGLSGRTISTARSAIDLMHVKVADLKGNPLMVSGVVTYQVTDSRRAALDVSDVKSYIQTQALAVLKKIASMYPYEAKEGGHSLKTEAGHLRGIMVKFLQERVAAAGAAIINFELTDLAYAPEIAQAMLIRQQAEAMVDARKIIVEGAVQISFGALNGLSERGIRLSKDQEAEMVRNLLVVICGDAKVQPTVNVGSGMPHH
jgi:hypothetical protein